MKSFAPIIEQARLLRGEVALTERVPHPRSAEDLVAIPDQEYLSLMSRRIFRAGLRHRMVDAKWPAFEEVFFDFDVDRVAFMSDEELETLLGDRRIIRHYGKIKSVRANATALTQIRVEHGSLGSFIGAWPGTEIVELWHELRGRFQHLGGNSGPYFLRMAGKDTFLLTRTVICALNKWGAFSGDPKSLKDQRRTQEIFNHWASETGQPLCALSMILAMSVE